MKVAIKNSDFKYGGKRLKEGREYDLDKDALAAIGEDNYEVVTDSKSVPVSPDSGNETPGDDGDGTPDPAEDPVPPEGSQREGEGDDQPPAEGDPGEGDGEGDASAKNKTKKGGKK